MLNFLYNMISNATENGTDQTPTQPQALPEAQIPPAQQDLKAGYRLDDFNEAMDRFKVGAYLAHINNPENMHAADGSTLLHNMVLDPRLPGCLERLVSVIEGDWEYGNMDPTRRGIYAAFPGVNALWNGKTAMDLAIEHYGEAHSPYDNRVVHVLWVHGGRATNLVSRNRME